MPEQISKWDEVIKRCMGVYLHREQYTYCLGACGELAESQRVKELYTWYYEHEKNAAGIPYKDIMGMDYDTWLKYNRGKYCFDCSGFLDAALNLGSHKYSSWDFGSMKKEKSLVEGIAGSVLWKSGHVGIDIGYGYFLHFPNFNRTCELGKISDYNWTSSHLITGVNYDGADAR